MLLSVAQVAALLHRSAAWVYDLCERGELSATRVGSGLWITIVALEAYLGRISRRDNQ